MRAAFARAGRAGAGVVLLHWLAGCTWFLDIDGDYSLQERSAQGSGESPSGAGSGGGGGGSASHSSGTSASGGQGGQAGQGGAGGQGGQGGQGGEGVFCAPMSETSCYSGPDGTEGMGLCLPGVKTCNADGTAYGPCVGEVVPAQEVCSMEHIDEDCDGSVNEGGPGCACAPSASEPCYSGPSGTAGTGVCKAGLATCDEWGTALGPCVNEVLPGIDDCKAGADEDCDGSEACTGPHLCSRLTGDVNAQEGLAIDVDGAGDVVMAGYFRGSISFGMSSLVSAGQSDIFIAKLSPSCDQGAPASLEPIWVKSFGNDTYQSALAASGAADGSVAIAGKYMGALDLGGGALPSASAFDGFVARYTSSGDHLWSHPLGDAGASLQSANGVAVDAMLNTVVVGDFTGAVDFGMGLLTSAGAGASKDVFVAKYGAAGAPLWTKRFGDASDQVANAVAVDANNDMVIVGSYKGSIAFGASALPNAQSSQNVFITKLSASGGGAAAWSLGYGDAASDQVATSVAVDAGGNVLVGGYFSGTMELVAGSPLPNQGNEDAFVAKFDATGALLWARPLGGPSDERILAVAADAAGNVIVTGSFYGSVDFGGGPVANKGKSDMFVVKLDADNNLVWSRTFGGAGDQLGSGAAVTSAGHAVLTGGWEDSVDVGGGTLVGSAGLTDALLLKLGY